VWVTRERTSPPQLLAVSSHGASAYGVFFLWDAHYDYWFQKRWSERLKNYARQHSVAVKTTIAQVLTMSTISIYCVRCEGSRATRLLGTVRAPTFFLNRARFRLNPARSFACYILSPVRLSVRLSVTLV